MRSAVLASRSCVWKRKRARPIRTSSPCARIADCVASPRTMTPGLLPRSTTCQLPSSRSRNSAWRRETLGSSRQTSQEGSRPATARDPSSKARVSPASDISEGIVGLEVDEAEEVEVAILVHEQRAAREVGLRAAAEVQHLLEDALVDDAEHGLQVDDAGEGQAAGAGVGPFRFEGPALGVGLDTEPVVEVDDATVE